MDYDYKNQKNPKIQDFYLIEIDCCNDPSTPYFIDKKPVYMNSICEWKLICGYGAAHAHSLRKHSVNDTMQKYRSPF